MKGKNSSVLGLHVQPHQKKVSANEHCSICRKKFKPRDKRKGMMHHACWAKLQAEIKSDVPPLYEHQKKTLELLERSEIVFDTSDPGTGKTRPALEAWWKRRRAGGGCALVLAVKSNLETVWMREARNWIPECTATAAYAKDRAEAFARPCDLYITNTDATKWLEKQPASFFKNLDTLIVDESSYYKHRTSQRAKALNKIKKYFRYRECMTGTPNSNTICDIWNQLNILDDGNRLGVSFSKFRNSVCVPVQVGPRQQHVAWEDRKGAAEAVYGLIQDISIRHEFDKCVDIPPDVERHIQFKLPDKLFQQYKTMERHAVLELSKDTVVGVNAAAVRTKLLQIASGAVYSEEGIAVLDTVRAELVVDLVEERAHSVVFFNWTHQRDQLTKLATNRGVNHAVLDGTVNDRRRKEIVDAYQKGFYQVLFIHPKTGAHGLTLTKGTATIWISPIYEPDLLLQGGHRIRRAGQTQKTETIFIEALGTVEAKVYEILMSKKGRMIDFLSLIQDSQEDEHAY